MKKCYVSHEDNLAHVAIKKSLLKEYRSNQDDRIVYLNNGDEFQISIFNPYDYVIGVGFDFNNKSGGSQMLVLNPGERVWLDRYLDNESHLLFSTYEVGTSQAVKEAIKNNGNLCIRFYKEKQYNHIYINNIGVNDHIDVYYNKLGSSCCDNNICYDSSADSEILGLSQLNSLIASSNCNVSNSATSACTSTISACTSATSACTYDDGSITYTASTDTIQHLPKISKTKNKSIETGRIEKGCHSNQKFNYVHKDFEYWAFRIENIKLLPMSQKQVNANELKKKYCHECGRKLNQKFKYCPYCGAKQ